MKLRLICVGKLSAPFFKTGVDEYLTRVRRYVQIDIVEIKEGGGSSDRKASAQMIEREGESLLRKVSADAFAVVLDERGKGMSSRKLATFFDQHMLGGTGELVFIIGGAYGLSDRGQRPRQSAPLSFRHGRFPIRWFACSFWSKYIAPLQLSGMSPITMNKLDLHKKSGRKLILIHFRGFKKILIPLYLICFPIVSL